MAGLQRQRQRQRERGRQRCSWSIVSLPLIVCFLSLLSCQSFVFAAALSDTSTEVRAVEGKQLVIPCEASEPEAGDGSEVMFLLFSLLTQQGPARIYRLNNLGNGRVTHWAARGYESRALVDWQPRKSSARLLLENANLEDAGFYGCHVKRSSSLLMTSTVNVTVFAPPTSLKIYDMQDPHKDLTEQVGPYQIDQNVTFLCKVTGGHPQPQVTWFDGSQSLEGSQVNDMEESSVSSRVTVGPLTRSDVGRNLTCRARNSDMHDVLSATVHLDLIFPPSSVRIEGEEDGQLRVREGVKEEIVCRVEEGRPSPAVSFRLDQKILPSTTTATDGEREMLTSSTAHLVPSQEQDGSLLTCLAHTQPFHPVLSSVRLSVLFAPKVNVTYGKSFTSKSVKAGDEVRFECIVEAKPAVETAIWTLNKKPLAHNPDEGVVVDGLQLLLRGVNRSSSGEYRCAATNSEGQGVSPPLYLKVRAKPEAMTSCSVSPSKAATHQGKSVTLNVRCVAKADGDLSKIFLLEVRREGSAKPEKRLYQHKPVFVLKGLREGVYQLNVTASNDLGDSPPYTINYTIHTSTSTSSTSTPSLPLPSVNTHSVSISPSSASSPSSKLSLTSLASSVTSSASSSISPTPSLFSFSLSTSFSSPISQYTPNSFNFRTPPSPSSAHSFLPSQPPGSEAPPSPWAVFALVLVALVALGHVVCLIPKLLVTFFVYKLEKRPAQRQRHHSSPRYARRRHRNSINRDMLRAHRLSDPPMPLPTITISPPASSPSSAFSSRKGSLAMEDPEGVTLVPTIRAPRASVDELETSSLCPSLQNEPLDSYSLQDEREKTGTPKNGSLLSATPQNGCAKNEHYLNSTFEDAFLHYNFIEKDNLKKDLNKRPRYRSSSPNFLSVRPPVRRSRSKDLLNKA